MDRDGLNPWAVVGVIGSDGHHGFRRTSHEHENKHDRPHAPAPRTLRGTTRSTDRGRVHDSPRGRIQVRNVGVQEHYGEDMSTFNCGLDRARCRDRACQIASAPSALSNVLYSMHYPIAWQSGQEHKRGTMRRLFLLAPAAMLLVAAGAGFATHAAAASVYFVSPFGDDTDSCTSTATACATVTQAIADSSPGDTIRLAAGAYVEQVVLTSSRIIVGAGQDESTIEAPASLAPNTQAQPQNAVVDISGSSTTVTMSSLTVAGPGGLSVSGCTDDGTSLDKGIDVHGNATLNLSSAAVRNIYNRANQGCQRGDGISVGSPFFGASPPDVGHAALSGVTISVYQKNGIAVRGAGSTLNMTGGRVTNNPSKYIASNGIEVVDSAMGVVSGTNVSGNECNVPTVCGNDPFTQTESDGVLSFGAGSGTKFTGMTVHGNDMGIYTDDGVTATGDNAGGNRYVGIYVDVDATGAVVSNDTASRVLGVGQYGIITVSGNSNTFSHDTARMNSAFDLDAAISGSDTNSYSSNHSTHASPSKAYWHST
jgi:hypothetical protein